MSCFALFFVNLGLFCHLCLELSEFYIVCNHIEFAYTVIGLEVVFITNLPIL